MGFDEWKKNKEAEQLGGNAEPSAAASSGGFSAWKNSDKGQAAIQRSRATSNLYGALYNAHVAEDVKNGAISKETQSLAKKVFTPAENPFEPNTGLTDMKAKTASDFANRQAEFTRKAEAEEAAKLTYDAEAGQAEIDKLQYTLDLAKRIAENEGWISNYKAGVYDGQYENRDMLDNEYASRSKALESDMQEYTKYMDENEGGLPALQNLIDTKKQYHDSALYAKEYNKWVDAVRSESDFNTYSASGAADTLNDRNALSALGLDMVPDADGDIAKAEWSDKYALMNAKEKEAYNYYLGKYGKEKAAEYLKMLDNTLNSRQAGELSAAHNNTVLEPIIRGIRGTEGAVEGFKGAYNAVVGNTEKRPTSTLAYASGEMGADNKGVFRVVNDAAEAIGGMAPTIAASMVNPGLGIAAMGVSSGGNAYTEMLERGGSVNEARGYGLLVGASEATLQYLMGGIGKLGGKGLSNAAKTIAPEAVQKISDVLGNIASKSPRVLNVLGNITKEMGKEGAEEALQTVLEPLFASWVTGRAHELPNFEEVAYSALLGALTSFAFEGAPQAVSALPDAARAVNNAVIGKGAEQYMTKRMKEAKANTEKSQTVGDVANDPEIAAVIKEIEAEEKARTDIRDSSRAALTPEVESKPKIRAKNVLERGGILPTGEEEYNKARAASAKTETARTGYLSGATDAQIYIAETLSGITGRDILFAGDDYVADGEFDGDNTIIVNAKRGNIVSQVIAHELTHSVEGTKGYNSLVKAVKAFVDTYSESGAVADWETLYNEVYAEYEKKYPEITGKKFDDAKAEKEIVSRVMETFFGEGADTTERQAELTSFIIDFAKADRNAATRIWYSLTKYAKRLAQDMGDLAKRAVWGKDYDSAYREHQRMLRRIEDIRDMFGRALMEAKRNGTTGERAFMFAGENANTANKLTLANAKAMLDSGADPETVRKETGWFKGYDGKWRFEIDDSDVEVAFNGKFSRDPDIRRYAELTEKVYFLANATAEEQSELVALDKKIGNKDISPNKLGDMIIHPKLFAAYPELADIEVYFAEIDTDKASYHPGFKEIAMSKHLKRNPAKFKKTLLHEVQHAVQDIEGLASGSNLDMFNNTAERSAYEQYYNTAGEIEARDTAERRDLNPEQRKNTRPDIDRSDVVFVDGENESLNYIGNTADGNNAYTDYDKPITIADVSVLRSIGRKSINKFTVEDIEKAQKWAYKFYKDMDVKSPFFRAWFGDWRAYENKAVIVADIPEYVDTNDARKQNRGTIHNTDADWDIRISREGETNTISHSGEEKLSEYGLAGIRSLVENAILLDSEVHEHHSNNAKDDRIAFDHKLYALGKDTNGTIGLYRITVEETFQDPKHPNDMRFHNLKYIEKVADNIGSLTHDKNHSAESTNDVSTTTYSIADLCGFVKAYDEEFTPAPEVNKAMLNADGTPKVMYHGTNEDFTVFDRTKGKKKYHWNVLGEGNYFTARKTGAEHYGKRIVVAYLRIKKPYIFKSKEYQFVADQIAAEYGIDRSTLKGIGVQNILKPKGYDGVILLDDNGEVVMANAFDSTQIKSATDNIGTFDGSNPDIRLSLTKSNTAPQNDTEAKKRAEALAMYEEMRKAQRRQMPTSITEESIYEKTGWYYDYFGNFVIDREAPVYTNEKTPSEKYRGMLEAENAGLRSENISLAEDAAKWKDRAESAEKAARIIERDAASRIKADRQLSPEYMPSERQVRGIVKELCDMFGGGYTSKQISEFTARLLNIYDSMSTNVRYADELTAYSKEISDLISDMQDVRLTDESNAEIAKVLRGELKTPLYLSESNRSDVSGGYGAAMRKYRGRVNLTTKERGTAVDVRYAELSAAYPEWFPADITNPADQLNRIFEAVDTISGKDFSTSDRYQNIDADSETVRTSDFDKAMLRILEGYNEVEAVPRTFADGIMRQLEFERRENKRELDRATEEEREKLTKAHEAEMERLMKEAEAAMEWETRYLNKEISKIYSEIREAERKAAAEAESAREAARRRAHERGADIQDAAIEAAKKDGSFTKKMTELYDRFNALEDEIARIQAECRKHDHIDVGTLRNADEKAYIKQLRERRDALIEDKSNLEAYINKVNSRVKDIRFKTMCDMIAKDGYLRGWDDKSAPIFYATETMRRNILDIAPKNKDSEFAKYIIKEILEPITEATYCTTVVRNQVRDRVKALNLATKPHKGDVLSESQFVQAYAEANDNIDALSKLEGSFIYNKYGEPMREGMTADEWRGYLNRIVQENPGITKDKAKFAHMKESAKVFAEIYDDLFTIVNAARVRNGYAPVPYHRGYFPHYNNESKQDGVFASLLKGLGLREQEISQKLPTSINGLTATFRPGIRYMSNAKQRSMAGFSGDRQITGAVEGLDRYIEVATDVAFQTDNIQNLRALSNAIRYATTQKETKDRVDEIRNNNSLNRDQKQERINEIFANKTDKTKYALNNFIVELEEYTNQLAGKKSMRDREWENLFGRSFYTAMKRITGNTAANAIAGNIGSAITNFIPLMDGGAVMHYHMLGAMWDMMRGVVQGDGFVSMSQFLTNRRGSDRLIKSGKDTASDVLGKPMNWVDNFTSELLMRARVRQNMSKHRGGMSFQAAMNEADTFVAGMMGDRSKGALPTIYGTANPFLKMFTMYQVEVKNQFGFILKDLPRDSDRLEFIGKVIAMMVLHSLFNDVYEKLVGRRPAFDPLNMLKDLGGDLFGWEFESFDELFDGDGSIINKTEKKGIANSIMNFFTTAASETPFIGGLIGGGRIPISSAMPDWDYLKKAFSGFEGGAGGQKIAENFYKGISPVIYYGMMPMAGGAVKKIVEGVNAYAKGGSYTYDAEGNRKMQYPIFTDEGAKSVGTAVKSAVFGKTSTEGGQEWIDTGFGSLSAKQTAAYEDMVKSGEGQREAWELVNAVRTAGKTLDELDVLIASDAVPEAKEIAFTTFVSTGEKWPEKLEALRKARVDFDDFLDVHRVNLTTSGEGKKDTVVSAIDGLNLNGDQKDALYLCYYDESGLSKAPWYKSGGNSAFSMPAFDIPKFDMPEIEVPKFDLSMFGIGK